MPAYLKSSSPAPTDGTTPLTDEEVEGLIPRHVQTRAELNQWEALNIAQGERWASSRGLTDPLSQVSLTELHRHMFGETWIWAGSFRKSDKNISPYHWTEVPRLVRDLVENTKTMYERSDGLPATLDEIATRFHHQLVRIHPWPNGNGRHSRLATDLILRHWNRPPFTWGSGVDLANEGEARGRYMEALRAADAGNYGPLLEFVRS
jgi:Fic-DOC domain mobile mystery protein B